MWAVFAKSFQTQLTAVLGYDAVTAKQITKTAKPKYKEIIAKLPEFEKKLAEAIEKKLEQQQEECPDLNGVSWEGISRTVLEMIT